MKQTVQNNTVQPTLNIKDGTFSDATYDYYTNEIKLNIKLLRSYSKKHNIEFYEYLARCINHECLHHVLYMDHSIKVSRALDQIAKKYKKYWMW